MPVPGYGAYQKVQAETSSPADLIALLYGALENDLQRAGTGLQAGDYHMVNERLARAQEIVLELLASLDYSQGDLPKQLAALYRYLYERLVYANVRKDLDAVIEAASLVRPIAAAWMHIAHPDGGTAGSAGGTHG